MNKLITALFRYFRVVTILLFGLWVIVLAPEVLDRSNQEWLFNLEDEAGPYFEDGFVGVTARAKLIPPDVSSGYQRNGPRNWHVLEIQDIELFIVEETPHRELVSIDEVCLEAMEYYKGEDQEPVTSP